MFCRYSLRTTDVPAARHFYAEAIGLKLPDGAAEGTSLEAWALHERARAAGAPAHWLGQIPVENVEHSVARLFEAGCERLGPVTQTSDGARVAVLRDPSGAVMAVRQDAAQPLPSPVDWHLSHTTDAEAAAAFYSAQFGWVQTSSEPFPNLEGGLRLFSFVSDAAPMGAFGNSARLPGVHTHWMYFFPIDDLDQATARVRALGGKPIAPVTLSDGRRIIACDDPQGAAFGMISAARA